MHSMELHDFYTSPIGCSNQDKMGRACSIYGGEENTEFWFGNPREPGIDVKVILEQCLGDVG
jgi:hypothetical protein